LDKSGQSAGPNVLSTGAMVSTLRETLPYFDEIMAVARRHDEAGSANRADGGPEANRV